MKLTELTNLLEKIYFEKKIIALLGNFNANLIHCDLDRDVSDFLHLRIQTLFYHKLLYHLV